ncbi:Methyltransferase type 11 [Candidatus Hydrogenisulfobacillus filiaventi]|uniref:Methyltransferase type 11 n=1 Tax=Candidatus Hydrogenisulfobacillus filiaventi TaxID=2707344 RepID=A0A6F8ZEI9_9FIRM|nr:Methyltransferase type 11 [Candidatus Hydrogenisulfobacillus filiaventi]
MEAAYRQGLLTAGGEGVEERYPGTGDADAPYRFVMNLLAERGAPARIRRALAADVVLCTWMNGEREEVVEPAAQAVLSRTAEGLTRRALATGAVFPARPMPEAYVRAVFQELLAGTALYQAQQRRGTRVVGAVEAREAVRRLGRYLAAEPEGLTAAARYYAIITTHEDLNAIAYYGRMAVPDFLLGTLHRPWSDMMATGQLDLYQALGAVRRTFTAAGEMLELTPRGEALLGRLRVLLEEAGEYAWRAEAQRWVIFAETDFDRIFNRIVPDVPAITRAYLDSLPLPPGAAVLEVGAGTGRVTFDLGLAARVRAAGGRLVALEPQAALRRTLEAKRAAGGWEEVEVAAGRAEALPFTDGRFDLVLAFAVLHFTELDRAVAEMVRVARPGGLVTATMMQWDPFAIPMVAAWFRPLRTLAETVGVPLGNLHGLPNGAIGAAFVRAGLERVTAVPLAPRLSAADPDAFLQFMLKGAAFYQHILSRLPFAERWRILQRLTEEGRILAAHTSREEQERTFPGERVYGYKPAGR